MNLRELWVDIKKELDSSNIPDSGIESEVIIRKVLDLDRNNFFATLDNPIPMRKTSQIKKNLQQRISGIPLSYITTLSILDIPSASLCHSRQEGSTTPCCHPITVGSLRGLVQAIHHRKAQPEHASQDLCVSARRGPMLQGRIHRSASSLHPPRHLFNPCERPGCSRTPVRGRNTVDTQPRAARILGSGIPDTGAGPGAENLSEHTQPHRCRCKPWRLPSCQPPMLAVFADQKI